MLGQVAECASLFRPTDFRVSWRRAGPLA